jgi:hypothetical protein
VEKIEKDRKQTKDPQKMGDKNLKSPTPQNSRKDNEKQTRQLQQSIAMPFKRRKLKIKNSEKQTNESIN